MRFWFTYPLVTHPYNPELMSREGVIRLARAAEEAGFDGMGFTDHPAPSHKWLTAGGHDALDPFVALALVAGVTERLLLIPNIVVLPYRNPFIVAKAAASLDLLSGGRFVLSVAAGYLRSEYRALGVDFERRNELMEEALAVLRGVWTQDDFAFEGSGFAASGVSANPKPGHLPIWLGGNSARTRSRVAARADGWNPFPASARLATTARTVKLEGLADLEPMIEDLWTRLEKEGRDRADVDVAFTTTGLAGPGSDGFDPAAHLEAVAAMTGLGVTWSSVGVPGQSVASAVEAVDRYGREVIAPSRRGRR